MKSDVSSFPQDQNQKQTAICEARVLYADTDGMGIVYHATYLRWFEAGRAHFMRSRGMPYSEVEHRGITLPVVETRLFYQKPARYDDLLKITTWIGEIKRAQLRIEYVISKDDIQLVRGYTRHAAVDRHGRPTRLPDDVRAALTNGKNNALR